MFCAGCGTQLQDNQHFCSICGRPAGTAIAAGVSTASAAVAPATQAPAVVRQVVIVKTEKSPALAAVLSFLICGLGQIYNGQIGKGILFFIAFVISSAAIWIVIGFLSTPALWIWGIVDAYKTAEELRIQGVTV